MVIALSQMFDLIHKVSVLSMYLSRLFMGCSDSDYHGDKIIIIRRYTWYIHVYIAIDLAFSILLGI